MVGRPTLRSEDSEVKGHVIEPRKREIRCQFIILARKDEPTPDYAPDTGLRPLPEQMSRHRITRKDELTPDYA